MVVRPLAFLLVAAALSTPAAAQTRVFVNPPRAARPVTLESLKGPAPVTLAQLEATLKANGLQWRSQSPGVYVYQHPELRGCGEFRRPADAGTSLVQRADRQQAVRVLTCVEQRQKPTVNRAW